MLLDIEIRDYFLNHCKTDHSFAQSAAQGECIKTEVVDRTRYSLGELRDGVPRCRRKQGSTRIPCDAETMLNVVAALCHRQLRQAAQQRNPLSQLRKFAAGQLIGQFRL